MYSVKILLDSVNPVGNRLTTWELTYPRMVHAELMTHRLFSRNSASSRAIPIEKMIAQVQADPVLPVWWGKNQSGMQAREEMTGSAREFAERHWLEARDRAVDHARAMLGWGAHKQIVNRLLEPWMWITVICSATEFGNWFNLRCHPDAQPEIKHLADMMAACYVKHEPRLVPAGEWHMPLTGFPGDERLSRHDLLRVSVGRCARVSYLTHAGERDPMADILLCDRLAENGHFSPFEHVAQALGECSWSANFQGWLQYRKQFTNEHRSQWPMGRM